MHISDDENRLSATLADSRLLALLNIAEHYSLSASDETSLK